MLFVNLREYWIMLEVSFWVYLWRRFRLRGIFENVCGDCLDCFSGCGKSIWIVGDIIFLIEVVGLYRVEKGVYIYCSFLVMDLMVKVDIYNYL